MNAVDAFGVQPGVRVASVSGRRGGQQHSADAVWASLAALSDIQRRTVAMTYYSQMSGREVADALAIDVPTVYAHLHDALTAMNQLLHRSSDTVVAPGPAPR